MKITILSAGFAGYLAIGISASFALEGDRPVGAPSSARQRTNSSSNQPEPLTLTPFLAYSDESAQGIVDDEPVAPDALVDADQSEPLPWDGFAVGDQHFRDKPRPIGSPLYFEDPFINTDLRPIFLWHRFPDSSVLRRGQLTVYAAQARLALTERLQFTATADGYSHLESPVLNDASGWNDLAVGLKYALIVNHEEDYILSGGLRWRLSNGTGDILQGNVDELSPYITAYKGWGKWNFMADLVGRIAMDEHEGNHLLSWDLHVDYELTESFYPVLEAHGVHYLSNGDRLPFSEGGLDYANIGSNNVAGNAAFWAGIGFIWKIADGLQWGTTYEFPLQNPDSNDLMAQRVTTKLIWTF